MAAVTIVRTDVIWLELGQMRSSGNGGGSRRNTCFRLLVDSCTKKPLDENVPEKKHIDKQSTHISKQNGPKPWFFTLGERNLIKFLADMKLQFAWPCQYKIHIRL